MDKYSGSYIQLLLNKTPKSDKRFRMHQKRLVSQKEYLNKVIEQRENEWQQEYFIIYNSYVLEENNPDN